ncbi:MAG: response regulator transcription factor [Bacteroidota bacterium]
METQEKLLIAPIKVMICDDSPDIRDGFRSLLKLYNDIVVVGTFSDVNNIAEEVARHLPNVILMDIQMPGRNGIEATAIIKSFMPDIEIIILSQYSDDENVFEALKFGASGYLLKGRDTGEKVVDSIRIAAAGGAPMNSFIAKKALNFLRKEVNTVSAIPPEFDNIYGLTKREMEVLECMCKGNSYKDICAALFISLDGVRSHAYNIYRKMHVKSKTEAVIKAISSKKS